MVLSLNMCLINVFAFEQESNAYITNRIGDVDGNAIVNAHDAYLTLKNCANFKEFSKTDFYVMDINNDNKITAYDARQILRMSAKLDVETKVYIPAFGSQFIVQNLSCDELHTWVCEIDLLSTYGSLENFVVEKETSANVSEFQDGYTNNRFMLKAMSPGKYLVCFKLVNTETNMTVDSFNFKINIYPTGGAKS